MEAANHAARARQQLPRIPTVPPTHEQPSPLYKVASLAQNTWTVQVFLYAAGATESRESTIDEGHVLDSCSSI